MPLCSLEEGLEEIQAGRFLIVVDDENRENEGDLVMAAEKVTAEAVNFIVTQAKGLLCMPVIGERLDDLGMPLMVLQNASNKHQTAFTVSVDYAKGTTTGISAHDRAATIKAMIDPKSQPDDFSRPGHLFPPALPSRWCVGPGRSHRGHRRPVQDGRHVPCRRGV